jgi:pilus assembly protein Flp/PilA
MTIIRELWNDESGATAAEYAILLAVIGVGIAGAATVLGTAIKNKLNAAAKVVDPTVNAA